MYKQLFVVAALLAGARPAVADECAALSMSSPSKDDLHACTKERPVLTAGAVFSLTLGGNDGFRWTLLGQLDSYVAKPLYFSVRPRVGGEYSEMDLLAGFIFRGGYGAGPHTTFSQSTVDHGSYTVTTTTAHTDYVVQRYAMMVFGGVRGTRWDSNNDGTQENDKFKTLTFGLASHYADHRGRSERIELVAYVRDGHWGGTVKWFNSVVGMEAGWVPVNTVPSAGSNQMEHTTSMFFWNFIDVGLFRDLF